MSILCAAHFHDEQAAYDFIESRLWVNGRVCPKCGVIGQSGKLNGASTRIGVYKCYACRKPFTVNVGTVFESSHLPMRLWLQAIFQIASSKKGISTNQLHRTLGVTLRAAWFLSHRIRAVMADGGLLGLAGSPVSDGRRGLKQQYGLTKSQAAPPGRPNLSVRKLAPAHRFSQAERRPWPG